jgi:hypothetical protein
MVAKSNAELFCSASAALKRETLIARHAYYVVHIIVQWAIGQSNR